MQYPPRIPLARLPTPLQPLLRLSASLSTGHRLWVKRDDLTDVAVSGNKLRKLEFVIAAAGEQGCDTLITCGGVQSNHCRATALVGAQQGFGVHLILRGEAPAEIDGNLLLDHLAGAVISHYPRHQYAAELDELFITWQNHYRNQGHTAYCIPTGASNGIGIWGYVRAVEELAVDMADAGIESAHCVCATGSGGTQAGLTLGAVVHDVPLTVWGVNVCDDEDWFVEKVAADIADCRRRYPGRTGEGDIPARVIDGYVGPGYGRAEPEVFGTISRVAREEALILDPVYTGKAFHGMLREIEAGRFGDSGDIIFVHTGGIFGLFPQRHEFGFRSRPGNNPRVSAGKP
jgi:D-cysteine desulfhydrase